MPASTESTASVWSPKRMNSVEVWFGIVERQAIRRGVLTFVNDLNNKIRASSTAGTTALTPLVWTETADET